VRHCCAVPLHHYQRWIKHPATLPCSRPQAKEANIRTMPAMAASARKQTVESFSVSPFAPAMENPASARPDPVAAKKEATNKDSDEGYVSEEPLLGTKRKRGPPSVVEENLFTWLKNAKLTTIPGSKSKLATMEIRQGWPCANQEKICFVREVYAAIVQSFLANLNKNLLVIGQAGIGKSFAGGYFVSECLKAGYSVVYAVRESIYVFDSELETATHFNYSTENYLRIVREMPEAILIHDCTVRPPTSKTSRTIVVSCPDDHSLFREWDTQTKAYEVELDVWSDNEIHDWAMFLGLDQAKVAARRAEFGAIPRYLVSDHAANWRRQWPGCC